MTIPEAIKQATDAGYSPKKAKCQHKLMNDENGCPFGFHYPEKEYTLLDPTFWQSLGKAMGWGGMGFNEDNGKTEWIDAVRCPRCGDWLMGEDQMCSNACDWDGSEIDAKHGNQEWLCQWHEFIDSLGDGKTAEDFFKTL